MEEYLTKEECFKILEMYKNWNMGQKSVCHAFGGKRTDEDDLLDARRDLILAATKRLTELSV